MIVIMFMVTFQTESTGLEKRKKRWRQTKRK